MEPVATVKIRKAVTAEALLMTSPHRLQRCGDLSISSQPWNGRPAISARLPEAGGASLPIRRALSSVVQTGPATMMLSRPHCSHKDTCNCSGTR